MAQMKAAEEIRWLKAWLKKETKRDWVPWLKPIIAANRKRLKQLEKSRG